ncbi:MAG: ATP-grasp domain-containing protein [Candidatus Schekmanbacteria bacterium]|nr:ATP-grasp domain-containing protein [Candidatus Schekmanbacteria bacterium]
MFDCILVANRGEIAVRILRTARELGVRTVAVHSEIDATAPHVLLADRACCIGPAGASDSYLCIDKLIDAARSHGACAVHPGYGFLSENADFADACIDAGLTWIGPGPAAIRAMGDKTRARAIAARAGVASVPGGAGLASAAELARTAQELGLPVLLKAAAGGGGKGMRRIDRLAEVDDAWAAARREAKAAFGDDTMLVEKLLYPARHVEIQIVADQHGRVCAFAERECSLQRRHQKIIEESPSTAVDAELRERMQEAACAIAREAGYVNAGTLEFLVDQSGAYYFLEMNTRLQVEHPVTELVSDLDLVRLQLEIAAGGPLSANGTRSAPRGHAIEARLYAEDPERGFLPTSGRIAVLEWPRMPGIRVDAGIHEGSAISSYYDPMLAKIIAWAPQREHTRRRLVSALEDTVVLGVKTNQAFLRDLLEDRTFACGATFTHTVEEWLREEPPKHVVIDDAVLLAAALAPPAASAGAGGTAENRPALGGSPDPYSPWRTVGHWRGLEPPP